MTDSLFPPATGMVDHLDSSGFGPSLEEIAFVQAYLAPGEMDPKALAGLYSPEATAARATRNAARRARDWPALGQYREANTTLADQKVDVVFIGDSITEIWGYAQPDLFGKGIVNRGISGQTSPQILLRFMADVVALKPHAAHILCGVNDIAGNTGPTRFQDYQHNVLAMIALAEAHGIRTILASLTPVASTWGAPIPDPGARIIALNAWLRDTATERGLVHADYYAALAGEDGALRPGDHRDGLHPGRTGYAAMRPVADAAIAHVLSGLR